MVNLKKDKNVDEDEVEIHYVDDSSKVETKKHPSKSASKEYVLDDDDDDLFEEEKPKKAKRGPKKKKDSGMSIILTLIIIVVLAILVFNIDRFFPSMKGTDTVEDDSSVVIATVNGQEITQGNLDLAYKMLAPELKAQSNKEFLLNFTILEAILLQEAEAEGVSLDISAEENLENFLIQSGMSEEDLELFLEDQELTKEEFMTSYSNRLIISQLIQEKVSSIVEVEVDEVEEYYKENSASYEQVNTSFIIVDSEDIADEVVGKLEIGEDFAEIASEYSIDPSGLNGGNAGFYSRDAMSQEFADVVFSLKIGEVSDVIESGGNYFIIRSEGKRTLSLEEAYDSIEFFLKSQKEGEAIQTYLEDLKNSAEIVIISGTEDTDNLAGEEEEILEEDMEEEVGLEEATEEDSEMIEDISEEETELDSVGPEVEEIVEEDSEVEEPVVEEIEEVMVDETPAVSDFATCSDDEGLLSGTVVFYYASWCSSCGTAKSDVESLMGEGYSFKIVLEGDSSEELVDTCFSEVVGAGYPQYICSSDGTVVSGTMSKKEIKAFADNCN